MNERIKELMEKAGIHENQYTTEKFAELMVQQFRNIVKDVYLKSKPEHRSCLLEVDAVLDETFGVE